MNANRFALVLSLPFSYLAHFLTVFLQKTTVSYRTISHLLLVRPTTENDILIPAQTHLPTGQKRRSTTAITPLRAETGGGQPPVHPESITSPLRARQTTVCGF